MRSELQLKQHFTLYEDEITEGVKSRKVLIYWTEASKRFPLYLTHRQENI